MVQDYDIEVVRNACVTKLDTKTQTVHYTSGDAQKVRVCGEPCAVSTNALFPGQETVHFDKVLVATGGTPRKLFVPGSDLKNIFTLRLKG